ncbi:methyltransferase family protein [Nocardioides sediminis]|uniref:methyltransferase family protein n=1 Tax=Nocardioides sediminis TaxID=433648 RepID=UPI000D300794|nr:isoprenylcysteine carboxylmethyltransferase family protein [Nocardioides sediminis]
MTLRARLTDLADRIPLPAETLGGIVVGVVVQRWRPWPMPAVARPAGVLCSVVGVGLVAVAWRERGPGDLEHPVVLVTTGVHARTRNPIYVGFTLAHLGLAAATRNGWMLATCPLSAVLVHRYVPREERQLHELFGAEYDAYRARVPRYL